MRRRVLKAIAWLTVFLVVFVLFPPIVFVPLIVALVWLLRKLVQLLKERQVRQALIRAGGPGQADPTAVWVKTYRDAGEFQRDAPTMAAMGYHPQAQSQGHGRVRMGRTALKAVTLLPWAMMRPSRKGDPITVAWRR